MDQYTQSSWQATKTDLKDEQSLREDGGSSGSESTDKLEEPSWQPHPVKAQFPDDLRPMWLSEPEHYAAGLPAVIAPASTWSGTSR